MAACSTEEWKGPPRLWANLENDHNYVDLHAWPLDGERSYFYAR